MRLSILANRDLSAANLAQLLLGAAWIPMWFYLNLYLQQVLGYSDPPALTNGYSAALLGAAGIAARRWAVAQPCGSH